MTPQRLIDRPIARTGAPTRRPLRSVGNVMAGCALVAAGLVLGPGVYPAAAVPGIADLPTPRMDELRLDGSTAFLTFTDYAETENRYLITIFERGTEPDPQ